MSTLSARHLGIVLGCAIAAACGGGESTPPDRLVLGVHQVGLRVPEGWEHLHHGLEHRFHRGLLQLSLADVGPVTRDAYLREIEHAQALFQHGQVEDARAHLDRLDVRSRFPGSHGSEFSRAWDRARDGGLNRRLGVSEVEAAYDEVLRQVEGLAPEGMGKLVERSLPKLDHGPQRDVAEEHPLIVDGRPGVRIETWDRLSHDHRKSYVFVLNEGNLLVARMELGRHAELQAAFDELVESLEIYPRPRGAW
jgi:hypothetical protein